MQKNFTIIALGSNLGNKYENLSRGFELLKKSINVENCSNIYESVALLPKNSPKEWNNNFYNCVFYGETKLDINEVVTLCNMIENKISPEARVKNSWSPRYLDIDIITFNDEIIANDKLTLPHKEMLKRNFVILPMADILPEWEHPVTGKKIKEYKTEKLQNGIKKLELKL